MWALGKKEEEFEQALRAYRVQLRRSEDFLSKCTARRRVKQRLAVATGRCEDEEEEDDCGVGDVLDELCREEVQGALLLPIFEYSSVVRCSPLVLLECLKRNNLAFVATHYSMQNSSSADSQHRYCIVTRLLAHGSWSHCDQLALVDLISLLSSYSHKLTSVLGQKEGKMHEMTIMHQLAQWFTEVALDSGGSCRERHGHPNPRVDKSRVEDTVETLLFQKPQVFDALLKGFAAAIELLDAKHKFKPKSTSRRAADGKEEDCDSKLPGDCGIDGCHCGGHRGDTDSEDTEEVTDESSEKRKIAALSHTIALLYRTYWRSTLLELFAETPLRFVALMARVCRFGDERITGEMKANIAHRSIVKNFIEDFCRVGDSESSAPKAAESKRKHKEMRRKRKKQLATVSGAEMDEVDDGDEVEDETAEKDEAEGLGLNVGLGAVLLLEIQQMVSKIINSVRSLMAFLSINLAKPPPVATSAAKSARVLKLSDSEILDICEESLAHGLEVVDFFSDLRVTAHFPVEFVQLERYKKMPSMADTSCARRTEGFSKFERLLKPLRAVVYVTLASVKLVKQDPNGVLWCVEQVFSLMSSGSAEIVEELQWHLEEEDLDVDVMGTSRSTRIHAWRLKVAALLQLIWKASKEAVAASGSSQQPAAESDDGLELDPVIGEELAHRRKCALLKLKLELYQSAVFLESLDSGHSLARKLKAALGGFDTFRSKFLSAPLPSAELKLKRPEEFEDTHWLATLEQPSLGPEFVTEATLSALHCARRRSYEPYAISAHPSHCPPPRLFHSATDIGHKRLLIFGGLHLARTNFEKAVAGDCHSKTLSSSKSAESSLEECTPMISPSGSMHRKHVEVDEIEDCAVVGEETADQCHDSLATVLDDVWILDLVTERWTRRASCCGRVHGRFDHSAVALSDSQSLLVIGGKHSVADLDIEPTVARGYGAAHWLLQSPNASSRWPLQLYNIRDDVWYTPACVGPKNCALPPPSEHLANTCALKLASGKQPATGCRFDRIAVLCHGLSTAYVLEAQYSGRSAGGFRWSTHPQSVRRVLWQSFKLKSPLGADVCAFVTDDSKRLVIVDVLSNDSRRVVSTIDTQSLRTLSTVTLPQSQSPLDSLQFADRLLRYASATHIRCQSAAKSKRVHCVLFSGGIWKGKMEDSLLGARSSAALTGFERLQLEVCCELQPNANRRVFAVAFCEESNSVFWVGRNIQVPCAGLAAVFGQRGTVVADCLALSGGHDGHKYSGQCAILPKIGRMLQLCVDSHWSHCLKAAGLTADHLMADSSTRAVRSKPLNASREEHKKKKRQMEKKAKHGKRRKRKAPQKSKKKKATSGGAAQSEPSVDLSPAASQLAAISVESATVRDAEWHSEERARVDWLLSVVTCAYCGLIEVYSDMCVRCEACAQVYYCSTHCQASDCEDHAAVCHSQRADALQRHDALRKPPLRS